MKRIELHPDLPTLKGRGEYQARANIKMNMNETLMLVGYIYTSLKRLKQ